MSRQDETGADSGANPGATGDADRGRGRRAVEIEQDIANIRARMDRTLDEIEYRLSPGQVTASFRDTVRDVVEGNPDNRLAMAIRNNPLPVALIGVGAIWLAIAMLRETGAVGAAGRGAGRAAGALATLAVSARDGADALRAAAAAADDPALRGLLAELALEQEAGAAEVEDELRRLDPAAVPSGAGAQAAWAETRRAATTRDRRALIQAAAQGFAAMLEACRHALHQDLPEETRVVVGAQFHRAEQMHNRLDALRQAA